MPRETPLHQRHVEAGAVMVDFGGFDMPQRYTSIRDEHIAVRERLGLFDVSHMGEVRFRGAGALATLQALCANDVGRLAPRQALYGVMCNEAGGIVDDIIVYRQGDAQDDYLVVINAACREGDLAWMRGHLQADTTLEDESDATALLALQGPRAEAVLATLTPAALDTIAAFHRMPAVVAGVAAQVSRTGYTGEDGFELYAASEDAIRLWDALVEAGAGDQLRPCGLGARDTLRLEAGLRLYGQDMDDSTDPFSCALGWTVKLKKGTDCIGADALRALDRANPPRRFVGLRLPDRAIARHGQPVLADDRVVGTITSGSHSFTLGCGIATASLTQPVAAETTLAVDIRGTATPVAVVPLPFYRRPTATAPAAVQGA